MIADRNRCRTTFYTNTSVKPVSITFSHSTFLLPREQLSKICFGIDRWIILSFRSTMIFYCLQAGDENFYMLGVGIRSSSIQSTASSLTKHFANKILLHLKNVSCTFQRQECFLTFFVYWARQVVQKKRDLLVTSRMLLYEILIGNFTNYLVQSQQLIMNERVSNWNIKFQVQFDRRCFMGQTLFFRGNVTFFGV